MDNKERILKVLGDRQMFTLEIAINSGVSAATTGKYLEILKAEGKVNSHRQAPYTYWKRAKVK